MNILHLLPFLPPVQWPSIPLVALNILPYFHWLSSSLLHFSASPSIMLIFSQITTELIQGRRTIFPCHTQDIFSLGYATAIRHHGMNNLLLLINWYTKSKSFLMALRSSYKIIDISWWTVLLFSSSEQLLILQQSADKISKWYVSSH